ncbi:MAG: tRNA dihydrouridine synthase [Bdellovibrionia bacterium]
MSLNISLTKRAENFYFPQKNLRLNFPLCLAPMVGLSHAALRHLIQEYMPQGGQTLWPTEMLNSRRLPHEELGQTLETKITPYDEVLVPQILGNEEEPIRDSVRAMETWGVAGIDINMGCPVQKALRHNYGVALMGDPQYAAEVVAMTTRYAQVPVSVKLRAVGSDKNLDELLAFVTGLQKAGAAWVCLHPRTAEQKRRGRADWSQIEFLVKNTQLPIIGNGDVQTAEDALAMLQETGCHMVMAGRGLAARPWMMWQLAEELGLAMPESFAGRRAPLTSEEEGAEYGRSLIRFIDLCVHYFGEEPALRRVRFYVRTTIPWLVFGQSVLSIVTKERNTEDIKKSLEVFFSQPQEMMKKTELRQ